MSRNNTLRDIFLLQFLIQPCFGSSGIQVQNGSYLPTQDPLRIPEEILVTDVALASIQCLELLMPHD